MDYKKLLKFIKQSLKQRKSPPTIREIAKKFGFKSLSSVQYHLKKLKQTGKLSFRYSQTKVKRRVARGLKPL